MEILTRTHCDLTLARNPSSHSLARDSLSLLLDAGSACNPCSRLAVVQSNLSRTHGGHNCGVDLDEFGVELGGEHHVFVNMHEREREK
ncbi:hypothetical protein HKD37_07G020598 [Glycine soja]